MLAILRHSRRPRCSGPPVGSSPSILETRHIPSTPPPGKCAGHPCRLEIKTPLDPAARRWKASYADKTGFPTASCTSVDLYPSQKHCWRRKRHFPPPREDFPASFALPPALSLLHTRTAGTRRSQSTPAWDGADQPCIFQLQPPRPDLQQPATRTCYILPPQSKRRTVQMGQPKDVLVVEDDREINELVGAYVQIAGFEYRSALDGASALSQARLHHPSLIVLDLML